jgi:ribosomal-protein-alanine N-acetyltransferase
MVEALAAVIDLGFSAMELNRIEAFVGTDNTISKHLLEKFGFTQEGLLREHYKSGGQIEDSLVYSLLRSDN